MAVDTFKIMTRTLAEGPNIDDTLALCKEVERLKKLAHREHTHCDDCWYSCPKSDGGCCNDAEGDDCNCGADEHNAEVEATPEIEENDEALQAEIHREEGLVRADEKA